MLVSPGFVSHVGVSQIISLGSVVSRVYAATKALTEAHQVVHLLVDLLILPCGTAQLVAYHLNKRVCGLSWVY